MSLGGYFYQVCIKEEFALYMSYSACNEQGYVRVSLDSLKLCYSASALKKAEPSHFEMLKTVMS